MKRIETIYIDIDGERLPFRFSVLSFIKLQEDFNMELTDIVTASDSINYFFCAYSAGCSFDNIEVKHSLASFWRLIEEYPEMLGELTKKLMETLDTKKK